MNYQKFYLKQTLSYLTHLIENNNNNVNMKQFRSFLGVKSSNRSVINFLWRSLANLAKVNVIDKQKTSNYGYQYRISKDFFLLTKKDLQYFPKKEVEKELLKILYPKIEAIKENEKDIKIERINLISSS